MNTTHDDAHITIAQRKADTTLVNQWDTVTDEDFGPFEDYAVITAGYGQHQHVELRPISRAALQWCYAHLPADCPRIGRVSFKLQPNEVDRVTDAMRRDKLVSTYEYTNQI